MCFILNLLIFRNCLYSYYCIIIKIWQFVKVPPREPAHTSRHTISNKQIVSNTSVLHWTIHTIYRGGPACGNKACVTDLKRERRKDKRRQRTRRLWWRYKNFRLWTSSEDITMRLISVDVTGPCEWGKRLLIEMLWHLMNTQFEKSS